MKPWLSRLRVEGFRSLRSVEFEPGPVTVLIGANGSGKSNLLQVLQLLPMLRTQSLRRFVAEAGGASALLHYGPKLTPAMVLEAQFEVEPDWGAIYRARLGHTASDQLTFLEETVSQRQPGRTVFVGRPLGEGHAESALKESARAKRGAASHLNRALKGLSYYHFHDTSRTSALRGNANVEDAGYLRSDGSNLAAYLYALKQSEHRDDRASWKRLGSMLRQVAPFVKELDPGPVTAEGVPMVREGGARSVRLHWIDERDARFGPEHLSDGTMRALALLAALTQTDARLPRFISIDEPELGLHPAALHLLVELVRSILPRTQVVLATQSPALLDHFEPEEVVVAERRDGATSLRRLDPKALENWRQEYSMSQLFDKNVLGGRP